MEACMDMHAIQTFLAIVQRGNFSGAAETLHRSQPAISRRIELLEHSCGATLFERLRGGTQLTDAGAALLPTAACINNRANQVGGRGRTV